MRGFSFVAEKCLWLLCDLNVAYLALNKTVKSLAFTLVRTI